MSSKKLQVFVSSTFTDLRAERQAAVEAILSAGHIPAGMELFAAGDESQMQVIRRWIQESDVLLLIVGGRYGSVEPTTGKSYTQLEYEYAIDARKPVFAIVMRQEYQDERVRSLGLQAVEQEHPAKLRDFRSTVERRLVRYWSSALEIKLAIHETMSEFARRSDLTGWVRGDTAEESSALLEQVTRLSAEARELRGRLAAAEQGRQGVPIALKDVASVLRQRVISLTEDDTLYLGSDLEMLEAARAELGDEQLNELHLLWAYRRDLGAGGVTAPGALGEYFKDLAYLGLLDVSERVDHPGQFFASVSHTYKLSTDGRAFVWRMDLERNNGWSVQ